LFSSVSDFCFEQGLPAPRVVDGPGLGFRNRARLAVRGRVDSPKIGIFAAGTHQVIDIPNCPIHRPPINQAVNAFKAAIRDTRTPIYSERAHAGLVRYLQIVVERTTGRVQVVVVCNAEQPASAVALLDRFQVELGESLQGLFWNGQPKQSNEILGPHWQRIAGEEALSEHLGGAQIFFPPGAFGQANLDVFESIVQQVHSLVQPRVPVVELYAGVGAVGLGLVKRGHAVTFNEIGSHSLLGLRQGLAALEPAERALTEVVAGAAEDVVGGLELRGRHVIVDPPRKGLHARVLQNLLASRPTALTYVSCGYESFLRDARALVAGGYRLVELTLFALFPYTDHAEILAHFENS
jgi:tRNA/tmRNA/rRNA uracil-C5-methylase (TrmA/RlmC/RlmD family)